MASSKRLNSAVRSVSPCDVKSSDVSYLKGQLHLLPEEEISEDGKFGHWSPAVETTLRLEIFQFLRNLEGQRPQLRVFHQNVGTERCPRPLLLIQ
jgi:hypothetical protein